MFKIVRLFFFTVAVCFCSSAARAQVALYANLEVNNLSQGNTWLPGGTFGLYDDFYKLGPIHAGADLRGSIESRNGTDLNKVLAGFRVAVKPPVLPIKPYVQASAGIAHINTAMSHSGAELAYELNGGVDLTFLPHLDWRIAEIGGGKIQDQPGSQFHIGTGLVLRFY